METSSTHCPSCGKTASGKFCNHCGAPLAGMPPARLGGLQKMVPWAALGLAAVALVVSLLGWQEKSGNNIQPTAVRFSESITGAPSALEQPPDLSTMSPREAADRLFNRVMTASENGNTEEALRFAPMAIQAYERVGTLDNDARFHLALIHLLSGNTQSAQLQVNKLRAAVPGHLLAYMLEHQIAERSGNQNSMAKASKAFLAAYVAEMATGRAEYQEHQGGIERFRNRLQANKAVNK